MQAASWGITIQALPGLEFQELKSVGQDVVITTFRTSRGVRPFGPTRRISDTALDSRYGFLYICGSQSVASSAVVCLDNPIPVLNPHFNSTREPQSWILHA
jgi:hypothetical protein